MNGSEKIHFVVRQEPIAHHGEIRIAVCQHVISHAHPIVIVPDALVVSVGMIADSLGSKMCRQCKLLEPDTGYIYFMAEAELAEELRRRYEHAELSA